MTDAENLAPETPDTAPAATADGDNISPDAKQQPTLTELESSTKDQEHTKTPTEQESSTNDQDDVKTPTEQESSTKDQDDAKKDLAEAKEAETKTPSKKVQEAIKYNKRDRHPSQDRPYQKRDYAPYPRKDYSMNVKSDLTSQAESSDPVEIRKQVEFYFSDSNLLNDKFLFMRVEGPTNRPVPVSVIHSFKRMRHFQPLSAIITALKDSTTLDVVDVDEETCIQRKFPLSKDFKDMPMVDIQKVHEDAAMARSVYVKGFGDEEPGTQFDIEAFFAEFGSTNSVRLRRTLEKTFKGSVFVEFDTEETQKKFLSLDPQPKWRGKDLQIKSKKQYCDDKVDDIKAGRIRRNENPYTKPRDAHNKNDEKDWRARRDADRAGGFKDRHHRHKGFGSGGRGRGGGRGGRGGHNRGGRYDGGSKKEKKDERNASAPPVHASTPSPPHSPKPSPKEDNPPSPSKKRPREEDDHAEAASKAKKVDVKAGGAEDAS